METPTLNDPALVVLILGAAAAGFWLRGRLNGSGFGPKSLPFSPAMLAKLEAIQRLQRISPGCGRPPLSPDERARALRRR